jgi:hypothetical protein
LSVERISGCVRRKKENNRGIVNRYLYRIPSFTLSLHGKRWNREDEGGSVKRGGLMTGGGEVMRRGEQVMRKNEG